MDQVDCNIPYEPDKIVYMENCQVTKVVPVEEVPDFFRGFEANIMDENGKYVLRYAETAAVVTLHKDEEGRLCSPEQADIRFIKFLDKDGNIIFSPLSVNMAHKPD